MSRDGQSSTADGIVGLQVCTFAMPAGLVFDWHAHDDHQLAWAASGVLLVRTALRVWVLPPTRALFVPAGVPHEVLTQGTATMRSTYVRPAAFPLEWEVCTPVTITPLMAELIELLEQPTLGVDPRASAETLLVGLLQPLSTMTIDVTKPVEQRARHVADALEGDPANGRTLAQWGDVVGASERTLARLFLSETGLSFGRWRTLVRLRAALRALARGDSVGNVAYDVGYSTPSAFIAAFRRETGVTPQAYFYDSSGSRDS